MKKIILVLIILLSLGCTRTNATYEAENYLNKFRNHDKQVMDSLDELLTLESITMEQKNLYRLIMKKQYTDLSYEITSENYNGDEATVEAMIEVYDYNKSKKRANETIKNNPDKFTSEEEIMNEQLKEMQDEAERIKYTLLFKLRYENETWVLETPNTEILEKIHGIYKYELV